VMDTKTDQELLSLFLAHSIEHIEAEIRSLKQAALFLEKLSRDRIIDRYGEEEAWRGLASDSFIGMVDSVNLLASRS